MGASHSSAVLTLENVFRVGEFTPSHNPTIERYGCQSEMAEFRKDWASGGQHWVTGQLGYFLLNWRCFNATQQGQRHMLDTEVLWDELVILVHQPLGYGLWQAELPGTQCCTHSTV